MMVSGTVCSGFGAAARDMHVYPLPYTPFPGTLNLKVDPEDVGRLGAPETTVTYWGIVRRLWPATLDGLAVHVMHPSGPGTDAGRLEVLAPVRLRDRLEDGDVVTVEVVRQVDGNMPQLRAAHLRLTAEALAGVLSDMKDATLEGASVGLVAIDERRWRTEFADTIFDRGKDTASDYGRAVFAMLGRSLRFDPDLLDDWIVEVSANSADDIVDAVWDGVLDAAVQEGPAEQIEGWFDQLVDVRAALWAGSMTTTYANFGAHDGARAGGAQRKTWQTTSGNPREQHAAMSGESVSLDETFSNGLRWPGDPAGSADQVANCECVMAFS